VESAEHQAPGHLQRRTASALQVRYFPTPNSVGIQLALLCMKQKATAAMLMTAVDLRAVPHVLPLVTGCAVSAGYGGSDCRLCELGTYSEGSSLGPCTRCPGDTTTLVLGATSASSCVCKQGYGQLTLDDPCVVCPANTWSNPSPGSRLCQDCPDNFVSPAGSTSINQCGKPLPRSLRDPTHCSFAWTTPQRHRLRWLYQSHGMCSSHQVGTNRPLSTSQCTCHLSLLCVCAAAVCGPGRYGPDCAICAVGSYCIGSTMFRCPEGMTSPLGASSQADCVCAEGRGGQECRLCMPGSWSAGGSRLPCALCNPGQTSIAGASSDAYCHCAPGQDPSCTTCPKGTWASAPPAIACTPCTPPKTTESAGASSPSQCVCPPGTHGLDCSTCEEGEDNSSAVQYPLHWGQMLLLLT
jgi:laminin alpha 1/2